MVRVGLCLYGTSPSGTLPPGLALQPALALRARIARISELAPGEGVGYGQTWHATRPTRVGLVTAGYADGISRRVSNRGTVLVHGRPAPIIGRVSMDQTTIDITAASEVHVGDTVTFFGEDSGSGLDLWQLANDAEGIPHDVLTGIGGRVARVYHSSHSGARATRLNGSLSLDRQLAYH
jgi:alanine racemase